LIELLAAVII